MSLLITCSGTWQHTAQRLWSPVWAGSCRWGNAGQTRMECTPQCGPRHCCCCASAEDPVARPSPHPLRTESLRDRRPPGGSPLAGTGTQELGSRDHTRFPRHTPGRHADPLSIFGMLVRLQDMLRTSENKSTRIHECKEHACKVCDRSRMLTIEHNDRKKTNTQHHSEGYSRVIAINTNRRPPS